MIKSKKKGEDFTPYVRDFCRRVKSNPAMKHTACEAITIGTMYGMFQNGDGEVEALIKKVERILRRNGIAPFQA